MAVTKKVAAKKTRARKEVARIDAKIPDTKPVTSKIVGQRKVYSLLQMAADHDMPALLIGETGTGKTSIIQDIANCRGQEWRRFNLTGDTTVDEFVGKYELEAGQTVWRDGILLQAMKSGQWLIVDEINVALPEILFALHSLLDDDKFVVVAGHNGEVVRPHKDFRFFATMNPVEEYAGTKELNKAFKSRFNIVMLMTYPPKEDEIQIVHQHTGLDKLHIAKMVDVATTIREAKAKDQVFYTCSTRDLIHWAKVTNLTDLETGFTVSVLHKADSDRKVLVTIYDQIIAKYNGMEEQIGTDKLTIDWFQENLQRIDESEALIDQRVKDGIKAKLEAMV